MKPKKKKPARRAATSAASEAASTRVREEPANGMADYHGVITIEPGKRGGRACIRGMRFTVGDVLGWLAAGMSEKEILRDYPELTSEDIRASLAYAAERERSAAMRTAEQPGGLSAQPSRLSRIAQRWSGKLDLPKSDPADPRRDYLLKKYWRHRR